MEKFLFLSVLLVLAGFFSPAAAAVFLLSTSGAPAFPDTEESLSAEMEFPRRSAVTIRMECPATPTNCAEVVLGRDSNLDGGLGWSEALLKFGWDAGSWFVSSPQTGEEQSETTPADLSGGLCARMRVDSRGRIASLSFCAGDTAVLPNALAVAGAAPDAAMWNCIRVLARGAADTVTVRVTSRRDGSMVFVK